MYRLAIEELYEWKKSANRKPLIIEGARQVGKTWLMKEFGKQAYETRAQRSLLSSIRASTRPVSLSQER